jgi:hypothetical protein
MNRWQEKAEELARQCELNSKAIRHQPEKVARSCRAVSDTWDRLQNLLTAKNMTFREAVAKVPGVAPSESQAFAEALESAVTSFKSIGDIPAPETYTAPVHTRRHMIRI